MIREILLFFILFSGGLVIATFLGIVWMTKIWEEMATKMRNAAQEKLRRGMQSMRTAKTIVTRRPLILH